MLAVFAVVFSFMMITVIIMAIGVIFGREPIKGSCGGLNNIGVERACGCKDVCEKTHETIEPTDTNQHSTTDKPTIYKP